MSGGQASITSLGCPGHIIAAHGLKGNREWPPSCDGAVCVFIFVQFFPSQIVPCAIYVFSLLIMRTFECYSSLRKKNPPLISTPPRALFMSLFTNGSINLLSNPWLVNSPSKKLSVVAAVFPWGCWGAKLYAACRSCCRDRSASLQWGGYKTRLAFLTSSAYTSSGDLALTLPSSCPSLSGWRWDCSPGQWESCEEAQDPAHVRPPHCFHPCLQAVSTWQTQ